MICLFCLKYACAVYEDFEILEVLNTHNNKIVMECSYYFFFLYKFQFRLDKLYKLSIMMSIVVAYRLSNLKRYTTSKNKILSFRFFILIYILFIYKKGCIPCFIIVRLWYNYVFNFASLCCNFECTA